MYALEDKKLNHLIFSRAEPFGPRAVSHKSVQESMAVFPTEQGFCSCNFMHVDLRYL